MGNAAKVGLVAVLALIVLVVALWDSQHDARSVLADVAQAPADLTQLAPHGVEVANAPAQPLYAAESTPRRDEVPQCEAEGAVSESEVGVAATHVGAHEQVALEREDPTTSVPSHSVIVDVAATAAEAAAPEQRPQPRAEAATRAAEAKPAILAKHVVGVGDTLSKIASRYYGSSANYYAIVRANRDRLTNPNHLPLGFELIIPKLTTSQGTAQPERAVSGVGGRRPAGSGGRYHVVRAGDTLSVLAQKYLGSARHYRKLFEANRHQMRSPSDLRIGVRLVIPNASH